MVGAASFEFGIKGPWIPHQNTTHGFLADFFGDCQIIAIQATAIGSAVQFSTKALAVQFETIGLFASTTHILNFITVIIFNFRGRSGSGTAFLLFGVFVIVR